MEEIERLREAFKDHAESDERNFLALQKTLEEINKKLDPVVDVYKAVLLSRSFITGVASVVVAIGAIGAGIMWVINHK